MQNLFSCATLITPNIHEAEEILAIPINDPSTMELAATQLGRQYQTNILIKGGHLASSLATDVLYSHEDSRCYWYQSERIDTVHTHGTGCTLSSAIASYLAQGYSLCNAVDAAKIYLTNAIKAGSFLKIGKGIGPVDHFYFRQKVSL